VRFSGGSVGLVGGKIQGFGADLHGEIPWRGRRM